MEKRKLKELIIEHKERFLAKEGLIKREIQEKLVSFIKHKEIVLITGIRRGGKSTLMRLICADIMLDFAAPVSNILYLNFEDERFIDFTVKDFETLYEVYLEIENPKGRKYFFLDEIQNILGWEKWVNRIYEFETVKFFITGSNAGMLSSGISTSLTGRNRQIVNWPFSFQEFLNLRGNVIEEKSFFLKEKKVELKRLFKEYFELGGFPEVLKINDPELLEQYFKDIIYRDVISRHSLRNIKEIKELTLVLASNIGSLQSYKNLKDLMGVKSLSTVKNYLEILEDVFLFFRVDLFDFSLKRQIYNPSKVYCIDVALCNAISFKFSKNLGHLYENLVSVELKRRNKEIYYWKSKQGKEVDFIIKQGLRIEEAIQVSLTLSDRKVRKREMDALIEVKEVLNPARLIILTEDEEGEESYREMKIEIIPLWKWFLI